MRIGRGLGVLAEKLLPSRRNIVETNLRISFPDRSEEEIQALTRAHFQSTGMGIIEAILCWWADDAVLENFSVIEGLEHLQQASAKNKGVILLSAHFTSLELGARLLMQKAPITAMYRKPNDPVIEQVMRQGRNRRTASDTIAKNDVRGLLRALKKGRTIWYAPDQVPSGKFAAEVPFFGHPAISNTATSRIAKISGAPVVPFFMLRTDNPLGYRLIIQPPLDDFPSGDDIADTQRINQIMESTILEAPEQYFWMHRRFKGTPLGDVYEQNKLHQKGKKS